MCGDRKRYNQFNVQMLERMFGEVIDVFWRFGTSNPPEWEAFAFQVNFYKKWDTEQVNELRGLEESLDLIPELSKTERDKTKIEEAMVTVRQDCLARRDRDYPRSD